MTLDLKTIQEALINEGASIVNLSIHPLGKRDFKTYRTYVAPKGIYPYLWYRGWDHTAGIDARAQNSPTTSVKVEEAADAVSVIIGVGAALVGLFANSPYEEGKKSTYKEARLTMWERMMRYSKIEGDRNTFRFPPQRFHNLAEYFNWMFGKGTGIHFVLANNLHEKSDYKGVGDQILIIEGNPSVLEYLSQPQWYAFYLKDLMIGNFPPKEVVLVKPDITHMVTMQFAQFTGARIRYNLAQTDNFPLKEFLNAVRNNSDQVEEIFSQFTLSMWIEGRDPGANFPDQEIWEKGDKVAKSVIIAPSAIQAGLIRNLGEATRFIDQFNWGFLRELRNAAIRYGLQGEIDGLTVYDFTKKVLEIAAKGLTTAEQRFLEYPLWVLQNKANGADRAIRFVEAHQGSFPNALNALVKNRSVVLK